MESVIFEHTLNLKFWLNINNKKSKSDLFKAKSLRCLRKPQPINDQCSPSYVSDKSSHLLFALQINYDEEQRSLMG